MKMGWSVSLGSAVVVAVFVVSVRAQAVDLLAELGAPIYVEDFAGQVAFPLSPETDPFALGGMTGHQVGSPLPPLPTLTGTEMAIAVQESTTVTSGLQSSGAQLSFTPPAIGPQVGLLGRFDDFATVSTGQFMTVAVTLRDSAIANGASGYLLDFQSGLLRLVVSNLGPLFLSGYDEVVLSQTADEAIRAGDSFELELLFDQDAKTAQAALTVGEEVFTTDATTSTTFDEMQIDQALVVNSVNNNGDPFASIASDAQRYEIYVPEPGGVAAALAALAALALRARRS